MMKRYKITEMFRYWLDNQMAKGSASIVKFLGLITIVVALLIGLLVSGFSAGKQSLTESVWNAFASTINAWVLYSGDIEGGVAELLFMAVSGIVGVLITSTLIGMISSAIEAEIEQLRKGKSKVLECKHVIILGFNRNTYKIIDELCLSKVPSCIVVADNEEKDYMEEQIHSNVCVPDKVKIVCRNVDITDQNEIECCSIENSTAVIIVNKDDNIVIKAILNVTHLLDKSHEQLPVLVAVVNRERNLAVAKYAGANKFCVFHAGAVAAKVMAQACSQIGISMVFNELFSYRGSEIYFKTCGKLIGSTFEEATEKILNATPVGLQKKDEIILNPNRNTLIEEKDEIIVLAENDDEILVNNENEFNTITVVKKNIVQVKMHVAVIGYTHYLKVIIGELAKANCEITLVEVPARKLSKVNAMIEEMHFSVHICERDEFEKNISAFDHIILLSDETYNDREADNNSVLRLLRIREIREKQNLHFNTIVELRQQKTKELLLSASDSEYIITSDIASTIAAQIVFNQNIAVVYAELLTHEGNEILLKDAETVFDLGKSYSTWALRKIALDMNMIYLGYLQTDGNEIVLNPPPTQNISLSNHDKLIFISNIIN